MTRQEFLIRFEELLGTDSPNLTGNEQLADLGSWDSMKTLEFMALADEELGTVVSPGRIVQCQSVNDLIALLGDKVSS
jgi:acyl carrier protein